MKQRDETLTCSTTEALLDRVRMNPADRETAKATLRRAEAISDALFRVTQGVQSVFAAAAVRIKGLRARPAQS